jgi:DNA polymerase III delta subunit
MAADPVDRLLAAEPSPLYLLVGDLVLAEPAASRLGAALAARAGGSFALRRRPADLLPLLEDLRTFSLFGGAKVLAAVDTAVLADRSAALELVADALAVAPPNSSDSLSAKEREGASRLMQALYVFGVDPAAGDAAEAVAVLPDWALAGKRGAKLAKREAEQRRETLVPLLEAARRDGLAGLGEAALAQLGELLRRGLPAGHALVLAERSVAADHPLIAQLRDRGAFLAVGDVGHGRDGFTGVDAVAAQLESEMGVGIRRDALAELARRTLRQEDRGGGVAAESTARLAAEYRKLADLAGGATIELASVRETVEDRGEEDSFQLLDALAEGRAAEVLGRLDRMIAGSDDPGRARLAFFALLAGFCRQLVAVRGVVDRLGLSAGERNYTRFKDRVAPALGGSLPEGLPNPLSGIHPFRLHRAYLCAGRLPLPVLLALPMRLLDTEMALKGEGTDPQAALAALIAEVATSLR